MEAYTQLNNQFLQSLTKGDTFGIETYAADLEVFLVRYPNSIVKNGVISHLLRAKVLLFTRSSVTLRSVTDEVALHSPRDRIQELWKALLELGPRHQNYHFIGES